MSTNCDRDRDGGVRPIRRLSQSASASRPNSPVAATFIGSPLRLEVADFNRRAPTVYERAGFLAGPGRGRGPERRTFVTMTLVDYPS